MTNIDSLYNLWVERADSSMQEDLKNMNKAEKKEAFGAILKFGTAGLRGFMRPGTNGMNIHTVAQATQGLANYLNKNYKNPSVVIARDSRHHGQEFVKVVVGVLCANNITTYFFEDVESTPCLSFSVRYLKCSAGICVTASHNPSDYNGYKVYGPDGCQISGEVADEISTEIENIDIFDEIKKYDYKDALESGYAKSNDESIRQAFINACCECSFVDSIDIQAKNDAKNLKVAYSALHGVGYPEVSKTLKQNGFENITLVKEQIYPDGSFPTASYPNPEMPPALELGIKYAKENDCDIFIATDPDADRLGVVVKHDGDYINLTGNEVGVLIMNYMCECLKKKNIPLDDKVIVTTIVTTDMTELVSKYHNIELRRVLTGFKNIGGELAELEALDQSDRFIFGFEESVGYMCGKHVRDKDGISASLIVCQMAAMYKSHGLDLVEVLEKLYKKLGYYKNDTLNFQYPGLDGQDKMSKIMTNLRNNPLTCINDINILRILDYTQDVEMRVVGNRKDKPHRLLPKSNVLEFQLENNNKLIIRPSGTEPKIKAYCMGFDTDKTQAISNLDKIIAGAKSLLE